MFREGDIVEIPLPDGRTAMGWILHISKHFKNVVGFVVFGPRDRALDSVIYDETTGKPRAFRLFGPIYTHIDECKDYGWKVFDHHPISESRRQLTRREIGGDVYVADERIGSVQELGEFGLMPMRVYEMPGVYREIEKAFGKVESTGGGKRTMFREGDIVEIPLPDGRAAIGWILHISKRFKNGVGFFIFGIKGQTAIDVKWDECTGKPRSMKMLGPLYTHIDACTDYGWTVFAHQPITEEKRQWTKRQIGGDVYVADERIGSVQELGESGLTPMYVYGMPALYREIERTFGKAE